MKIKNKKIYELEFSMIKMGKKRQVESGGQSYREGKEVKEREWERERNIVRK